MFKKLLPEQYPLVRAVFNPLDHHLAIASILEGNTLAPVYVDDPADPRAAFTWFHSRAFLVGSPENLGFSQALHAHIQYRLLPQLAADGQDAIILYASSSEWDPWAETLRPGKPPIHSVRQYFRTLALTKNWRKVLLKGYTLCSVEEALAIQPPLQNLNWLMEEVVSERASLDDFLQRSFGICVIHEGTLVGWCLSEYNTNGRCEVGVATAEEHQRRGLGTAASLALVEEAFRRGFHEVGWHCWKRNTPSAALAQKSGFQLVEEHNVIIILI